MHGLYLSISSFIQVFNNSKKCSNSTVQYSRGTAQYSTVLQLRVWQAVPGVTHRHRRVASYPPLLPSSQLPRGDGKEADWLRVAGRRWRAEAGLSEDVSLSSLGIDPARLSCGQVGFTRVHRWYCFVWNVYKNKVFWWKKIDFAVLFLFLDDGSVNFFCQLQRKREFQHSLDDLCSSFLLGVMFGWFYSSSFFLSLLMLVQERQKMRRLNMDPPLI